MEEDGIILRKPKMWRMEFMWTSRYVENSAKNALFYVVYFLTINACNSTRISCTQSVMVSSMALK